MYRNYRDEENESKEVDPSDNRVASVKRDCIRRVDGGNLTQEMDDVFYWAIRNYLGSDVEHRSVRTVDEVMLCDVWDIAL